MIGTDNYYLKIVWLLEKLLELTREFRKFGNYDKYLKINIYQQSLAKKENGMKNPYIMEIKKKSKHLVINLMINVCIYKLYHRI